MKEDDQNNSHKESKKFVVTEVREKKKGYVNPVIVNFQNGELNEKDTSDWKVTLSPNESGRTNVEVKTSYDHVFKESKFSNDSRPKQIIAIKNKKTNKVKIVEVDHAVLINSALISSTETSTEASTKTSTETAEKYDKSMKDLKRSFGGKKLVSHLEQRERLNLNLTPVPDDVLKTVEGIMVTENVSLNETEAESIIHLLPPCHRDVKVLSEVYNLYEILSEEELLALKEEITSQEESKASTEECSTFFHEQIKEAKKSDINLSDRLAGVLFAECLIKFLKISSKKIATKNVILCSFSSIIHNKLLNEFCIKSESSITRPLTMRDKCTCFIIALILICCDFKINLKLLSVSAAIHFKRLARLARIVGAVPLAKDEAIFTLKLPLPALPKSSKAKINRK